MLWKWAYTNVHKKTVCFLDNTLCKMNNVTKTQNINSQIYSLLSGIHSLHRVGSLSKKQTQERVAEKLKTLRSCARSHARPVWCPVVQYMFNLNNAAIVWRVPSAKQITLTLTVSSISTCCDCKSSRYSCQLLDHWSSVHDSRITWEQLTLV